MPREIIRMISAGNKAPQPACAMIKTLPNPDFLQELLKRLRKARRSVVIVNYLAELLPGPGKARKAGDDPVRILAECLIKAKKRGVEVSAILEGSKLEENYPFYRLLKDAGCDIWLDTSKTMVHLKAALIDDRLIFMGSHNLTRAGLTQNEELSILTDDPGAIRRFRKQFRGIARQRETVRRDIARDGIPLPEWFVRNSVQKLFGAHAELAFDLYLLFCGLDAGTPKPLPIDARGWCHAIGIRKTNGPANTTPKYRRYFYMQRLNRVLYQLQDRFHLIRIDRRKDMVTRVTPPAAGPKAGTPIMLPRTYWTHGWSERLSFPAKYFLLVSLTESVESPFSPWWSLPMSGIAKRYGCSKQISRGASELADYNLLEIIAMLPVKRRGSYSSEARYFRLNPFYRMDRFEKGLKRLEGRFAKDRVAAAGLVAKELFRSHDLDTIESICALMTEHGQQRVLSHLPRLKTLPRSSSRRCIGYLKQLLEA